MKRQIARLLVIMIVCGVLCGCGAPPNIDTPSNHSCINCGATATHYTGAEWRDYSMIELYYCDRCYNQKLEEADRNNSESKEIWWE